MTISERLAEPRTLILDGATGTELQRRGVAMSEHAWCGAGALLAPDVLRGVHADYIRAGAEVIIVNSYAAAPHHLEAAGLGDRAEEVNRRSAELARQAREQTASKPVWIAGSLSLLAPNFNDADRPSPEKLAASLTQQAIWLAEAGVDLLVLEMLRDVTYSTAAVKAALSVGLPVWSGFSCVRGANGDLVTDGHVTGVMPLADVLEGVTGLGEELVAIMHSEIADTGPALDLLRRASPLPLGAWPNSGNFEPPNWHFDDVISPDAFARICTDWVDAGVRVVGGCCGLGPDHIRAAAERLG
ncbi:MAG TPA: homocysteine S-methyltransferase family protein [Gammaproteobacteria bacterium]|nr:homocysteine S-methyltransferase family protein [Gammaproteobacteria bacterium]